MLRHDRALALSAVEVEQLRDLRSRLGRRAVSDKAVAALRTAYFQLCTRVAIDAGAAPASLTGSDAVTVAASADMAGLRGLRSMLERASSPEWTAAIAAGAPQAILSRRLALAGREPAKEEVSSL